MSDAIVAQPTGAGITPQMPVEPPKEVKEMVFEFDPALVRNDDNTTITTDKGVTLETQPAEIKKPAEEAPVSQDKKADEKVTKTELKDETKEVKTDKPAVKAAQEKVEKPKTEEQQTGNKSVLKPPTTETPATKVGDKGTITVKPITPVKENAQDAFDYTGFSPAEVTNLKNMSRQSREFTANLIKEKRQLESLKDAQYLQHEEAYVLSPEFKQLQTKDYFAKTEGKAWEQALLNIRAGKKFRDITGFDANGSPILSEERDPTDADDIRISQNLSACIDATRQTSALLQQYPQQFKGRVAQDLQAINAEQQARFAWVQDPKLLEYSVEVEGAGQKKISDIKAEFKSLFPPYLANNPGVEVASNLMVALIIQGAELREAQNAKQIDNIKLEEAKRGEPSSDNAPIEDSPAAKKGIPKVFSTEGFPTR